MKLKQIALAALAAVAMGHAMAATTGSQDTSTLMVAVGDQNHTYLFDTGITMASVINTDVNYSVTLPNWASFNFGATSAFNGLDEGSGGAGVRWTVVAATNVLSNLGNTVMSTNPLSAVADGNFSGLKNAGVRTDAQRMLSFGNSANDLLNSGSNIALKGGDAFAGDVQFGIGNNTRLYIQDFGDPAATSSLGLYLETVSSISLNAGATLKAMDEVVTLNPTTGQLTIAAAVPEPESYALMVAGLAAVGFVAARRRRA
ncbi:PEP-CTERM sorting domain-containing protein [Pelomonas sp. KK5]|uniref:PEP-CTERM sorting domain-containing protein n=1 Tax=Pelomonas sp. KK5 TaxID=1855730 RepID=UPI00097C751F|nr:PEP-CTERM sorting domain-containing protein [Pelomonas sp. KK5]